VEGQSDFVMWSDAANACTTFDLLRPKNACIKLNQWSEMILEANYE